ncbi:MAG: hypothetical protein ACFFF4_08705 [Candidatus Thorarchaeota archaeon]
MASGSKYFGWIATLGIVLAAGWFLLPSGYETLIQWLSPQLGNYVRPTLVLLNIILVDPFTNLTMVVIWGVAGFIGGVIAGTKKGAFVVGLFAWLTTILLFGFCIYMLIPADGSITDVFAAIANTPLPPDSSIADVLGIPLVQSMIGELLNLFAGMGGGGIDPMSIIYSLVTWVVVPVIVVIVTAIIGAVVRPKE